MRGVFANLDMIHLCGPTFQEASKDYPGADFVGAHTNFLAEDFARTVQFVRLFAQFGAPEYHAETAAQKPILANCSARPIQNLWPQVLGRQYGFRIASQTRHAKRQTESQRLNDNATRSYGPCELLVPECAASGSWPA